MNKLAKLTAGIVLALSLTLTACEGGDSPKSLAKQNYEATKDYLELTERGAKSSDPKVVALTEKAKELYKKIEQLSKEDKKIYDEEYQKLSQKLNK